MAGCTIGTSAGTLTVGQGCDNGVLWIVVAEKTSMVGAVYMQPTHKAGEMGRGLSRHHVAKHSLRSWSSSMSSSGHISAYGYLIPCPMSKLERRAHTLHPLGLGERMDSAGALESRQLACGSPARNGTVLTEGLLAL